ncbi:MAG: DUF2721 domain-containing protein [Sphingomicrobium sp.]
MTPSLANIAQAAQIAQIIQLSVAPVFLLAGVGAFLNACVSRLARIVDRARRLEPLVLAARGEEHDRLVAEIRLLDKRIGIVGQAIFFSVLSALLTCAVVILLFATGLTNANFSTAIALLFIASMLAIGAGFAIFLVETRLGSRSVRIRNHILDHEADEQE